MVFDPLLGVIVMYGGAYVAPSVTAGMGGEVPLIPISADTWTWDGSDWTERHPAHRPVLFRPSAAYDYVRHQVVLLAEANGGMQTWTYDGNDWTPQTAATGKPSPSRGAGAPIGFDPASMGVVSFGTRNLGGEDISAVWRWNGQTWIQTAFRYPGSTSGVMGPDFDSGSSIVYVPARPDAPASTLGYDSGGFHPLHPAHTPSIDVNSFALMDPDPPTHRILLFGWSDPNHQLQTWAWSGSDWGQVAI